MNNNNNQPNEWEVHLSEINESVEKSINDIKLAREYHRAFSNRDIFEMQGSVSLRDEENEFITNQSWMYLDWIANKLNEFSKLGPLDMRAEEIPLLYIAYEIQAITNLTNNRIIKTLIECLYSDEFIWQIVKSTINTAYDICAGMGTTLSTNQKWDLVEKLLSMQWYDRVDSLRFEIMNHGLLKASVKTPRQVWVEHPNISYSINILNDKWIEQGSCSIMVIDDYWTVGKHSYEYYETRASIANSRYTGFGGYHFCWDYRNTNSQLEIFTVNTDLRQCMSQTSVIKNDAYDKNLWKDKENGTVRIPEPNNRNIWDVKSVGCINFCDMTSKRFERILSGLTF